MTAAHLVRLILLFGFLAITNDVSGETLIVGGRVLQQERFPAVVEILEGRRNQCTGTFISKNIVLTAAHCLVYSPILHPDHPPFVAVQNVNGEKTYFPAQRVTAPQAAFGQCPHLNWPEIPDEELDECLSPQWDVALMHVDGESNIWLSLAEEAGRVRDPVKIIGFGQDHQNNEWIKRIGWNRLASASKDEGYTLHGPARQSRWTMRHQAVIGVGDSGGPMLNRRNEILGVSSMMFRKNVDLAYEDQTEDLVSVFAPIHQEDVAAFLKRGLMITLDHD
jgi:hypothetical protein